MPFSDLVAATDRAALRHLGGSVSYVPRGSGNLTPITVNGVFDLESSDPRGDPQVAAVGPALFLREADLVTAAGEPFVARADDGVLVNGAEYRVREPKRDGMGGVLLHLQEA